MYVFKIFTPIFFIAIFLLGNCATRSPKNTKVPLDEVPVDELDKSLQVATISGVLQGVEDVTTPRRTRIIKYLGIPYAAPPVKELRWKPPQPAEVWNGILNARVERPYCIQMSANAGMEDCLYMNIYVPRTSKTKRLYPVMVWFYGGRFMNGNANYSVYGPDYLLDRDVAFVSFNYRLGVFGFLSSGDLTIPGNYGLKDQLFALKWLQQHATNFGVDPKSVTIFGNSSGAACISYLLLVPQALGLFHRAIMQSGSALCPWAYKTNPRKVFAWVKFACGIYGKNMTSVLLKLQKVDARKLRIKLLPITFGNALDPLNGLPFAPTIEPRHPDAALTEPGNELFKAGHFLSVPLMIGFTDQEASLLQDFIEIIRPYIAHWDLFPSMLIPANLNITSKGERKKVAAKIRSYYFGKRLITFSSKTKMMNFLGDSQFVRSITHTVKMCAKHTTTYMYVFSYEGYIGRFCTKQQDKRKVKGAGHYEDVFYLFLKNNIMSNCKTDWKIISAMTEMWTNFAKTGHPTPIHESDVSWPPVNASDSRLAYLDINTNLTVQFSPRADAMAFWEKMYTDYARTFYTTY